ncbi:PREDICTED: uncharacterized protein LOC104824704 [Tarenaya hassleriana]|uniref:uncharacterized protein LOC104824704 n=1 Tax=Tarenaya hassleriana TaxID=28532 RepID=UPI00053C7C46|nr:PREDICTED: uncharacterized protein LOC104824704 [Tarenaya hassleriana]
MGDQPEQLQQPPVVYPNTFTKQYPDPSSSSSSSSASSGSFGTVFIVLAVILVLSALACVFGRIRSRGRFPKQQDKPPKHEKTSKKSREIRPVEHEPRERGDLEFGFDLKRPLRRQQHMRDNESLLVPFTRRPKRGGGGHPPPAIKHGSRFKLPENGDLEIEFRPGH